MASHRTGLDRKLKFTFASAVTVLVLAVSHLPVSVESRDDLSEYDSSCCMDDTEFREGHCFSEEHGIESIHLDCPHGAYLYESDELKKYYITTEGTLFTDDGSRLEYGSYCMAYYNDEATNETLKGAMVCFEEQPITASVWTLLKTSLISISVAFLILTLYIYWIIPDLRQTEDKVTCIAIVCLMTFLILLGLVQVLPPVHIAEICVMIGFGIYFFAIAYFSWLNVIMLNVWKNCVLHRWQIKERTWFLLNNIYGWTIPFIALVVCIVMHFENPSIGQVSCFFNPQEQWLFLYLPMSIMLGINIVLGIWTTISLHQRGDDISHDRKKRLRFKLKLYLRLFILAGVTWIFEVLSFSFGEDNLPSNLFWFLCDCINALHGALIFLVLIIWRSRIKRELAGKRLCCFMCPEEWANVTDIEQEQLNADEGRNMGLGAKANFK